MKENCENYCMLFLLFGIHTLPLRNHYNFIVLQSTSALNSQPLVALSQTMNTRLTHLILAHNKIAGFMQIVTALAVRTLF